MPTPENINPLLDGVAGNISQEAQDAYARLLLLIEGGTDPAEAVRIVQAGFNGAYVASLQQAFGAILGQAVEAGFVTSLPVSGVPLSARLYRNTLQTSMEVAGLVKSHAAGIHDARELAIRLYDGYNPTDGIQRPIEKQSLAELPRPLRELMKADIKLKGSYEQLLEQVQTAASRLKTQALRAAYSEAIDAWAKGKGGESLKRKLDVAYREKTRYHANRIAQTELARAHADKVASEFMHDDTISVVKVIMSPAHPMRDICNLFAEADLYGLGKGCYPKEKAPKPVYHPFCRCVLSSRPNLDAADAREVPGGVKDFLNGLPKGQAAQMVGSEARLFEVVKGGKSIDEVLNAGKDKAYHLKRLGDNVPMKPDFNDFFHGRSDVSEYPIAKMSAHDMALFGSNKETVWLSRGSLDEHKISHPEITASDYLRMQEIISRGEVYQQKTNRFVLLHLDGVLYRAAMKVIDGGDKVYMLSIFKTTDHLATIQIRNKFSLARRASKG